MKLKPTLTWFFIILAFVFFFFSLRSKTGQLMYSLIALSLWGIAFLMNKLSSGEKGKKP